MPVKGLLDLVAKMGDAQLTIRDANNGAEKNGGYARGIDINDGRGTVSVLGIDPADFDARLERTRERLRAAATAHAGHIVQATSLGVEDMVVTDLLAQLIRDEGLQVAIGTLETGKLHAQTVELIGRIDQRYGLAVEVYRPQAEAVIEFVRHGQKGLFQVAQVGHPVLALDHFAAHGRFHPERVAVQAAIAVLGRADVEVVGRVEGRSLRDFKGLGHQTLVFPPNQLPREAG